MSSTEPTVTRVLAPVAHPAEVEMLVESGAEELYAGLQLAGWTERFGSLLWVNRRGPTQGNSRVNQRGVMVDICGTVLVALASCLAATSPSASCAVCSFAI